MLQADEANDAEERAAGNHEEEAIDRGRELGEQGDIEHDAVRADENVDHDHVEGEEGDDQQFREIEVKFQFSKHPIGDPSRFSEIGALVKACRDNTRSDDAFWDAVAEFLLHYVICLSVHKAATQNPRMTGAAYKSLVDKNAELNSIAALCLILRMFGSLSILPNIVVYHSSINSQVRRRLLLEFSSASISSTIASKMPLSAHIESTLS